VDRNLDMQVNAIRVTSLDGLERVLNIQPRDWVAFTNDHEGEVWSVEAWCVEGDHYLQQFVPRARMVGAGEFLAEAVPYA